MPARGTSGINNDVITFHDGLGAQQNDVDSSGGLSNNSITLGDGRNDGVISIGASSNNKIILGNGLFDSITLAAGAGRDYLATGTGANDIVIVQTHTNPDTFAFALGTNGTSFTTVNGAATGDKVVVNGGQLGIFLAQMSVSDATTLASFIGSLTLMPAHTYIGYNTHDTYIVTDTLGGQTGAIDVVGVFQHSTLAFWDHVLTLG